MDGKLRTMTFLFTDIEGSTRIWERNPDAMQTALKRHDEILRHSIENTHGFVFKTVGDAFCAAHDNETAVSPNDPPLAVSVHIG